MSDGGSSGHRPAVGDYYLWREDDGDGEIRAGDIGVVVELRKDGRMVVDIWGERGEWTSFIVGEDDFASNKMAYLAEGAGYWEGNKVLFLDERVLESIFDDLHVRAQAHETLSNLNALVRLATETAEAAMSAILLEKEKARFLAEYRYEELWEDHRKTIKRDVLTPPHPTVVESAAVYLVEHHWRKHHELVKIKDKTFAALFHMAEALGWPPTEARDDGERELMTFIMDTVITGESSS